MKDEQIPKYLTQDQVKTFFSKIHHKREYALFGIIYKYGLRVSEASFLNLDDIDLERRRVKITRSKGGVSGERTIFPDLLSKLRAYLKERTDNSPALFTGKRGRLKKRMIQTLFYKYAHKAKLEEYSIHSLRHSLAVHLLEDGWGIEFVQDQLGHKNIKNTQIYSKITNPRREEIYRELENSRKIVKI
jgi:integrase/recombinase XerD